MSFLRRIVDERLVILVILLNAVALFMGGDSHGANGSFWFWVDYGCVIYFLVETGIKLGFNGWRTYWRNSWNKLDFIVISMSAPMIVTPWLDIVWLAGLTAMRLLRLFRLFRLFRFIPGRDSMAAGIVRSLKASVGVFLGVILVNVIMALGAVVLFGNSPDDPYFGTPWRACHSMFQVFTVEGWDVISNHIVAQSKSEAWAAFARLYFVFAVLGGGILGLSLVNAVFVDQMTSDNTDTLEHRVDALTEEIRMLRDEIRALRGDAGAASGDPPDA